ncbi:hypothetical protein JRO89_XS10G0203700 [Xanthoceras sorbifolium]|uniref:Leucine-rich repeat-containing protein n=1 Tax=Xanthoceras sorbifolium TaxID=99658 RepID=A0ABQ8HJQ9_9ROSI|nr:hypothetical protein JRO89_XS10G0203700 [Xanthoceras sorbifolium]
MTRLSADNLLKEHQTRDPNSITSLTLTHKALSDVSCLSDFKNLERLDLSFNNLSSLEGLKSCVNLKWLSVVQNKLQSLKGIEGLSNLNVLNAGKNKLQSMDGVQSLVGLRALILNDNEIVSMCRLDQMKDLNTLVLSRNPISEIGVSLLKAKSITKLSLSNCQVQMVGSSLKFCSELKELRLAHNDIKVHGLITSLFYFKCLLILLRVVISRGRKMKRESNIHTSTKNTLRNSPESENEQNGDEVLYIGLVNFKLLVFKPRNESRTDTPPPPPPQPINEQVVNLLEAVMRMSATQTVHVKDKNERLRDFCRIFDAQFDGRQDPIAADRWLKAIRRAFSQVDTPSEFWVDFAVYRLTGDAVIWWENLSIQRDMTGVDWEYAGRADEIYTQEFRKLTDCLAAAILAETNFRDIQPPRNQPSGSRDRKMTKKNQEGWRGPNYATSGSGSSKEGLKGHRTGLCCHS